MLLTRSTLSGCGAVVGSIGSSIPFYPTISKIRTHARTHAQTHALNHTHTYNLGMTKTGSTRAQHRVSPTWVMAASLLLAAVCIIHAERPPKFCTDGRIEFRRSFCTPHPCTRCSLSCTPRPPSARRRGCPLPHLPAPSARPPQHAAAQCRRGRRGDQPRGATSGEGCRCERACGPPPTRGAGL